MTRGRCTPPDIVARGLRMLRDSYLPGSHVVREEIPTQLGLDRKTWRIIRDRAAIAWYEACVRMGHIEDLRGRES